MSEDTKVLVEVRGNTVSVQVLAVVDGRPAVSNRGFFFELGTLWEVTIPGARPNTEKKVWQWRCDGFSGNASSKASAVSAMLADCGYQGVPLTAATPDLLEGLL
jgi:hypothetical protein